MSQKIEWAREKVPIWWPDKGEPAKPSPASTTQGASKGKMLGRGQRIIRPEKEPEMSSSSTTTLGSH